MNRRRRLRLDFMIFSVICCVLMLISMLFLSYQNIMLYLLWVLISISTVAFSVRLAKGGVAETIAALLVECFLFTMYLIVMVSDGSAGRVWMILRFVIPFMNVPVWWQVGRWIQGWVDLSYRNRGKQAAEEINRIMERKIQTKTQLQSRLEEYVDEKREVMSFVKLLQCVSEDEGGDLLLEMFEEEERRRTGDFMHSLAELAKDDRDYQPDDFTGRNASTLLRRVTNDIARCGKGKVDPLTVTAADSVLLRQRLGQLGRKRR